MKKSNQDLESLSKEPYGKDYATRVVKKLTVGSEHKGTSHYPRSICYSHREYCGIGLFYYPYSGKFEFSHVYEGTPAYGEKSIISFEDEGEMIDFLARQSDYSFSGYDNSSVFKESNSFRRNNQRISRKMLTNFLNKK
jgi:hypothetical protein